MNEDFEQSVLAGTFALNEMSRYANGQVQFGKCFCTPECDNLRLTLWRLPREDDRYAESREPYAVATGAGPNLWLAAVEAYKELVTALDAAAAKEAARDIEIEYLNHMWEQR